MAIWNVDWLNANSQRDYPLADSSSLKDTSGAITLPRDFLVDLVLSVPVIEGVEPGLFHLQQLAVLPQGVMVTLGYVGTPIASQVLPWSSLRNIFAPKCPRSAAA